MIIDIHCHWSFSRRPVAAQPRFSFESAPSRTEIEGGPTLPTHFDACIAPRAMGRLGWRIARWWQHLPGAGHELDAHLEREYEVHLGAPGPVERFVLLAFDAVHDDDGRCVPLPGRGDRFGSDMYTSNSLVRVTCQANPGRYLFGASVHPYRRDAVACIDEVFAAGACLLKWIPLHQNINPADPRTLAVLRRCGELGLPLLVHMSEEFTLTTQRREYVRLAPLLEGLRGLRRAGNMPPVILAHAATPVTPWGERESHRALLAAWAGEFAEAPLYADISALGVPAKVGFMRTLLRRQALHPKLLFGSDFPVPALLWRLKRELGRSYREIAPIASWPQRTCAAMRAVGFNEIVFHRAAGLLPNVRPGAKLPDSRTQT